MEKLPCVICGNEIAPLHGDDYSDISSSIIWNSGDVAILHCGYGSKHDSTNFVIAFCDSCLDKSLQDGRIAVLNVE